MNLAPLFKAVVIGAAESSLDVAGSALLPGAWPILKGALAPVLNQLKQRFGGQEVTASKQVATDAAAAFEKDERLQEMLRTNLLAALEPVVSGAKKIDEDVQKLMLISLGNTRAIEEVAGGVKKVEDMLAGGVDLKPEAVEKLASVVARYVQANEQTQAIAQRALGQRAGDLLRRQAARIETRAVELVREHQLDRAVDELQEGVLLASFILNEAPSDTGAKVLLGYLYKATAQVFTEAGQTAEADEYYERAREIFELVKDVVPADEKTVADVASAMNGVGNVYQGRGDFAKAIDYYRLATSLVPSYAYAWHDMFAAYDGLARTGNIDVDAMRHALQRAKETGQGQPGLGADYIAQLETLLGEWERKVAGAGNKQSSAPGRNKRSGGIPMSAPVPDR